MRIIYFPIRIDLSSFKIVNAISARELLILIVCVVAAMLFVFSGGNEGVIGRLIIAVPLAAFVFLASMVPIRGYKIERFLMVMVSYYLSPRIYLHQSAAPVEMPVVTLGPRKASGEDERMKRQEKKERKEKKGVTPPAMPRVQVKVPSLSVPQVSVFLLVLTFFALTMVASWMLYTNRIR